MQQNTRVFVCFRIFEAEAATKQNTRIFVCFRGPVFGKHVFLWVSVCGPLLCDRESNVAICTCFCVFLNFFEARTWCGEREARLTKIE